jgi:hypothetical protein
MKTCMVVNFRTHEISRGTRKLTRTPMLIKKKLVCYYIFKNKFFEKNSLNNFLCLLILLICWYKKIVFRHISDEKHFEKHYYHKTRQALDAYLALWFKVFFI